MRTLLTVLTFLLLAPCNALSAQMPPALQPGARVRVSVPPVVNGKQMQHFGRWTRGTVRAVDEGQLVLQVEGEGEESGYTIPLNLIRAAEVSRGSISAAKGAKLGVRRSGPPLLAGGAVLGTFFGWQRQKQEGDKEDVQITRYTVRGAAAGAVMGIVFGTIQGASQRERWDPVSLPVRAGIGLRRDGSALQLGLSLRTN